MWLFDPRVAELRKLNELLVKILSHPDSEIADRCDRVVLIDENPPTQPIPTTTPPNVDIRIIIEKKNTERVESLDVSTLSVTIPKMNRRHVVIRGDEVGNIVIYKRSNSKESAYVRKESEIRGGFYLLKSDMCYICDS